MTGLKERVNKEVDERVKIGKKMTKAWKAMLKSGEYKVYDQLPVRDIDRAREESNTRHPHLQRYLKLVKKFTDSIPDLKLER